MTTPDAVAAALERRQAQRLTAQLLSGPPAEGTAEVARWLLAVQAQDPRGARLAVRARSRVRSAADVDAALTRDRSVVVTWLNRGTLHLVPAEDYWWLHPLTTPPLLRGNTRRLNQEGVPPADAERAVRVIERAVTAEGPLTRVQLAERIAAAGVRTQGQAIVHLLALASLRGLIVRGPMTGRDHAYALVRDWLGAPPAQHAQFDRDRALAELAVRYLAGHGPATDRDLAKWAGLPLRDARHGLAAIAGRLAVRDDGLADLAERREACPPPPPRLLGAYDPLLLGWDSRDPVVGPHGRLIAINGLFRPFALVRGRAAGTWSLPGGKVALAPFTPLPDADAVALAADAAEVERFLSPVPGPADGPAHPGGG
ncbi:MAG TPA: winged helix DNA-binding domain-containing protein [Streptosporangiaceae bacterium]|nr:winged helix DNA-binding domain-containing protein [Streptosporangiaceae bacterium]